MKNNTTQIRRAAHGLCIGCGKQPARSRQTYCDDCAEDRKNYQSARRARAIVLGEHVAVGRKGWKPYENLA